MKGCGDRGNPLLRELLLRELPGCFINGSRIHRTPLHGHGVRLLRTITALPAVAGQLPADGDALRSSTWAISFCLCLAFFKA